MPAVFTIFNRPRGYDQTQKQFSIEGTTAITGTYTSGTGIAVNFATASLNADGSAYTLPPTYTGANGPGQGVPTRVEIDDVAGYVTNWVAGFVRIYSAAGTEVSTGTVPVAISAAGIYTKAAFLRG
jgi:hypothetical protein